MIKIKIKVEQYDLLQDIFFRRDKNGINEELLQEGYSCFRVNGTIYRGLVLRKQLQKSS